METNGEEYLKIKVNWSNTELKNMQSTQSIKKKPSGDPG